VTFYLVYVEGLAPELKLVPLFQLAACFRVVLGKGKGCLFQALVCYHITAIPCPFITKRKEPVTGRKLPAVAPGIPSDQKR